MSKSTSNWLLTLLLLVGLAVAALWQFRMRPADPPAPLEPEAITEPAIEDRTAPRYPVPPLTSPSPDDLVPLPALDDSDGYFRLGLKDIFGRPVDEVLVDSGLIDRFVATVDNLPRSHVAESIRPLKHIPGSFQADAAATDGQFVIRQDSYLRFEPLVASLTTAKMDDIVATYRRFYPLLQQAYVRLGYPQGYFNDRVIEVIDHLLETPQPEDPISLTRPKVLYEFADPALEALSSGQKMLLRTGAANADQVKQFLAALRSRLVSLD